MRIPDPELCKSFASHGKCEWCGKWCKVREGAHVFATGMGGGRRIDIRINLVSLGSTRAFACECHTRSHNGGSPTHDDMLGIVAKREKTTKQAVTDVVRLIQRIPKDYGEDRIREMIAELDYDAKELAERELVYCGVLASL